MDRLGARQVGSGWGRRMLGRWRGGDMHWMVSEGGHTCNG
jgi:hypothetical protein